MKFYMVRMKGTDRFYVGKHYQVEYAFRTGKGKVYRSIGLARNAIGNYRYSMNCPPVEVVEFQTIEVGVVE